MVIAHQQRYRPSASARLRAVLAEEFMRRKRVNPRYSLRAFARSLALEHSTLSQLLRGKRPLTWKAIRGIAGSMRWTGGAVLQLAAQRNFPYDSRAIALRLGISVDDVNIALTDLCLFGLIELHGG